MRIEISSIMEAFAGTTGEAPDAAGGPTDPAVWSPRGGEVRIVASSEGRIDAISVETTLHACEEMLKSI
jgi:hypothetical protein